MNKFSYLICLSSQPYSENILLRLVSKETGTHSYSVGQDPLSLASDNWGLWYPNLLSIQQMRIYKTCFRHAHLFVELHNFKYSLMHGYRRYLSSICSSRGILFLYLPKSEQKLNSVEQSPSWGASLSSASYEIPRILRIPKLHCRFHNLPLVSILSHIIPVYNPILFLEYPF
jgi:hypothetical protein